MIFIVELLTIHSPSNIEKAVYCYESELDARKKFKELIEKFTTLYNISSNTYNISVDGVYKNTYKAISKNNNVGYYISMDPFYLIESSYYAELIIS